MALYKLQLPKMGESVSEATLTKWLKQPGDFISEDEAVLEIATDKVDSDVPSPVSGVLKEQLFQVNQIAQVGDIIAIIETSSDVAEPLSTAVAEPLSTSVASSPEVSKTEENATDISTSADSSTSSEELSLANIPGSELWSTAEEEKPRTTIHSHSRFYSPLVKSIAQEEGLTQHELDSIPGSGTDGRVTKTDILNYIQKQEGQKAPISQSSSPIIPAATPAVSPAVTAHGDEIIEMDRMRKLIAQHMVNSVKTSPHVCSFVEADVTNLVRWRNKIKDAYKKREGENMTFTPLFIEAIAKALRDFPMINISVDGDRIIKRKHINIGMAAALPSGNLIVPVIKNADQLSLVGLSKSVNDLANRSRANKLKPDDTTEGTFTFTNIGAFGNIMGTPIINQPQVAILAVGTITKKPAVIETEEGDYIGIRHMMYLSMSYDHRVVDGALGGTFLKRVADYLEKWDVNREV